MTALALLVSLTALAVAIAAHFTAPGEAARRVVRNARAEFNIARAHDAMRDSALREDIRTKRQSCADVDSGIMRRLAALELADPRAALLDVLKPIYARLDQADRRHYDRQEDINRAVMAERRFASTMVATCDVLAGQLQERWAKSTAEPMPDPDPDRTGDDEQGCTGV